VPLPSRNAALVEFRDDLGGVEHGLRRNVCAMAATAFSLARLTRSWKRYRTFVVARPATSRKEQTCPNKSMRISRLLLHRCNTWLAIEDESCFPTRSPLVIRFAEDQDKIINKDAANSRLRAGQYGRTG
jgi:hypothetical protein